MSFFNPALISNYFEMMCVYGKKGGKEFNPPLNTSYKNKGLSFSLSQRFFLKTTQFTQLKLVIYNIAPFQAILKCIVYHISIISFKLDLH